MTRSPCLLSWRLFSRGKAGADGRFVLGGIPKGARIRASFESAAIGKPVITWDSGKPPSITLDRRLGAIEGRLKPPVGHSLSGTIKLSLRRETPGVEPAKSPYQVAVFKTVAANGDGTFRFPDLLPGSYAIEAEFEPATPVFRQDRSGRSRSSPRARSRTRRFPSSGSRWSAVGSLTKAQARESRASP